MRVAVYVPAWPPGFTANGIVTYASYLVPALRKLGHEVFVLAQRKTTESDDPYTIDLQRFVPSRTLWDRASYRLAPDIALFRAGTAPIVGAIRELAAKHRIDVLEIEESFGWSVAVADLKLLPVVVRLHGPYFLNRRFDAYDCDSPSNKRREAVEGKGIRRAHYVTAPSAAVLDSVRDRYGLKLAASRVVWNSIKSVDRSGKWNCDTCSPNAFLFVGRFDRRKGGDLAIRAFAQLSERAPSATLIFVGPDSGIEGSNGALISYEQFVQENISRSVRSKIKFYGGLSWPEVMSLRSKCFATIIPSRYEVANYTLLEAMSLGCPIVTAAVGGVPELIRDRRNGLLVSSENPSAIAAACYELIQNRSLAEQVGDQAWLDCRDLCDPEVVAAQTTEAYGEAIKRFRSRVS